MLTLSTSLAEILDLYEQDHIKRLKMESRVSGHRIHKIREALGSRVTLSPMDIEEFIEQWREKKPATRNRYRALFKHILKWGAEREYVMGDIPLVRLKTEAPHNERTRRISPEEEARLVKVMNKDLREAFYGALDTGLRKGALLQLTFKDIVEGVLVVPASIQKHKRSQRIPLTARLKVIMMGRLDKRPTTRVFAVKEFYKQWDQARKDAEVEGLHWHDIRGEFASRLSEKKVPVEVISMMLGHASIMMTQRYLRPRVEQFDEAIASLGV